MARTPAPPEDREEQGRITRAGGLRRQSLTDLVSAQAAAALYGSALHRLRLKGRYPLKLLGVPVDPVPGNPHVGERIAAGRLIHAGHTAMTRAITFQEPAPPAWTAWAHGWEWLRDIAAHQSDVRAGAALAEPLVSRWLDSFAEYDRTAWGADVTGMRLLMAFGHAPLILSSRDQVYRSKLLVAIATWARHLDRAAFRLPDGLARARALCGLYAAGLLVPGGEGRTAAALAGLDRLLGSIVLPDGGIVTRTPVDALALAELLLFTANAPAAVGSRAPPLFADTLARLVPSLRGLALGDGMIGAWGGGAVIAPEPLERLARLSATGTALARGGRWSGYHRLSAGRTVLVCDAGPPPAGKGLTGHAGTLAFELSDGQVRIVTNCGGARGLAAPPPQALADGLPTTAAHSTLTIADTNSTQVGPGGRLGRGVEEVALQLRASEEGQWLDASHDGYVARLGLLVRRRLFLSPDGADLRGEDVIEPVASRLPRRRSPRRFDIRFHLGPAVTATPTADGAGALLRLEGAKGASKVWAMKARLPAGASVGIEPSLWLDAAGTVHRTQQLVISGEIAREPVSVGWSFRRAGK